MQKAPRLEVQQPLVPNPPKQKKALKALQEVIPHTMLDVSEEDKMFVKDGIRTNEGSFLALVPDISKMVIASPFLLSSEWRSD